MTSRRWLRVVLGLLVLWTAHVGNVSALPFDNFQHTQWTAEDGVPADIRSIAQTVDGWLWLGTTTGLYRFDGVRFERAPGELGHLRIHELYAAPTGELYVGVFGGNLMLRHVDGRVATVPGSDGPVIGTISTMAQDDKGNLWAIGTSILRWDGKTWQTFDDDSIWERSNIRSLVLGRDGTVWAAHDNGVKRLAPGARCFEQFAAFGGGLSMAPDGAIWVFPKDGVGVRRLAPGSGARSARFNASGSRFTGLFDAKGALWKLRCPQVVCLAGNPGQAPSAPVFDVRAEPWQLSGPDSRQILEDREGNVWIATQRGLDRFRATRLRRADLPAATAALSMATDGEGRVWVADGASGTLRELLADGTTRVVPGPPVKLVVQAPRGGILLGGKHSIWRQEGGKRTEIPMPPGKDGKPVERRLFVLIDDGKVLWAATPETSLIGWFDGKWHDKSEFKLDERLYMLAPGGPGQLWMAQAGGALLHYDNDKLSRHDARQVGFVTGMFPGPELAIGGDGGLGVLIGDRIRLLHADNPDVLRSISGMVTTPDGDRWLNGAAGIIHVRAADWKRALAQPETVLRYELFDAIDGYPGRSLIELNQPSARSGDGRRLWFIGTEGVVGLDTGALYRNSVPPTLALGGVQTPQGMLAPAAPVRIPAGAERFSVRFTTPSLRMPERVRFSYRLDGFDRGWQDGGARRAAEYTNVPPGAYRFYLRAYNEDGVASVDTAELPLVVAPTLVQTLWFRILCTLLLAALGFALYRYRIRYLTARLTERLRVKTDERERIARALHDSFLQSLQSLLMRLDAVTARLPEGAAPRPELEKIRAHANDAIVEGRDHVAELRADEAFELEPALARSVGELGETHGGVDFGLQVEGGRRRLRADVAREAGEIVREALRNAALHAGAASVRATLHYEDQALRIEVADDGRGLDAAVAQAGARPGHWGLAGMHERAARIDGRLHIDSHAGKGTTVQLTVPARRAYRDD